jgi:L-alanine-DL-glutamate epimerase-like enolase superfamily enzyme
MNRIARYLLITALLLTAVGHAQDIETLKAHRRYQPDPNAKAHLVSWEKVELQNNAIKINYWTKKEVNRAVLKILASNGVEAGIPLYVRDRKLNPDTVALLKQANMLDPYTLYDSMKQKEFPQDQIYLADLLAWDLVARTANKPLHAVLGTRQQKIKICGDMRWEKNDTPESYAKKCATGKGRFSIHKFHFPGNHSGKSSLSVDKVIEVLRAIRKEMGPDARLAWDPHPGSAAKTREDALRILKVMDELGYEWLEGPVGNNVEDIPINAELRELSKTLIEPEGFNPTATATYDKLLIWYEGKGFDQWHYDVRRDGGLTQGLRIIEFLEAHNKKHPDSPLRMNFHWCWTSQWHLIAAFPESICMSYENPWYEEVPKDLRNKDATVKIPNWPGIYKIDALNEKQNPK